MSRRAELELWYRLSTGGEARQWLAARLRERALVRNARAVSRLNGAHRGQTVYIIGSGPQLGELDPAQRAALERRVTIGVNRTQYVVKPRYFLSAYPSEVLLARATSPGSTAVNMRPEYDAPVVRGAVSIQRRGLPGHPVLPDAFDPGMPYLVTYQNVALAATNLALVLGARKVVYVGVEQRNSLHYYDAQPDLRRRIVQDLTAIEAKDVFTLDHPHATFEHFREVLSRDPGSMASAEFHTWDHVTSFSKYFEQLREHGVEPVATTRESVVFEAGASLQDLDQVLRLA